MPCPRKGLPKSKKADKGQQRTQIHISKSKTSAQYYTINYRKSKARHQSSKNPYIANSQEISKYRLSIQKGILNKLKIGLNWAIRQFRAIKIFHRPQLHRYRVVCRRMVLVIKPKIKLIQVCSLMSLSISRAMGWINPNSNQMDQS